MKSYQKKKLNTEKLLKKNYSNNSFLIETSFNSDIDQKIRDEIEQKYSKSKINSEYIFPRMSGHKKTKSRQLSSKNSFEALAMPPCHRASKSSIHPAISESKLHQNLFQKNSNITLKLTSTQRVDDKKNLTKIRGFSCRQIKTDRIHQCKSPKAQKKYVEIYSGYMPLTCKKINMSDIASKLFTPLSQKNKSSAFSTKLKKTPVGIKEKIH